MISFLFFDIFLLGYDNVDEIWNFLFTGIFNNIKSDKNIDLINENFMS